MTGMPEPLVSVSLSADEALALRHLLVWMEGIEKESRAIEPGTYAAQFSEHEREILAALRRLFVQYDFPGPAP